MILILLLFCGVTRLIVKSSCQSCEALSRAVAAPDQRESIEMVWASDQDASPSPRLGVVLVTSFWKKTLKEIQNRMGLNVLFGLGTSQESCSWRLLLGRDMPEFLYLTCCACNLTLDNMLKINRWIDSVVPSVCLGQSRKPLSDTSYMLHILPFIHMRTIHHNTTSVLIWFTAKA